MTSTSPSPAATPLADGAGLRLPTPPGVTRRFWARHPWFVDSLVAAVYLVPTAIVLLVDATRPGGGPAPVAIVSALLLTALIAGALLFRRHAPLLALAISCTALLPSFPNHGQGDTLPVMIALYAVAVYRNVRSAWIGLAAAVGISTLGAYFGSGNPFISWVSVASQDAVLLIVATVIGVSVGDRMRYVASLVSLAAQLAHDRDRQAQLARSSERARIARELHDIVAHSLSVMVALADGADALAVRDSERSRAAMREVASTGRGSMAEMRRLLGVLGDDDETADAAASAPGQAAPGPGAGTTTAAATTTATTATAAPLAPQPGADQLVDLVDSFRSAGLPARLELSGRVPGSPGVQLTIYRVVQESLTNALRYASQPSIVSVRLSSSPGLVEVVIDDDGHARAPQPSVGGRRGIIGLGERVALYGGTLEAGPIRGGGWRVRATMSLDEGQASA
ncbi:MULTISPECIES: histidine kinase [unclassified Cryobacterium]|uniref:sensor histidine kinase n=1 Tax=unclassified Cryobacterium TaxID=2649013 RepID=UPI00106AB15A|nr:MULTISPECIES: histidine kinase [unclassified Cryobacterium]TFB98886.1 two-component sensor histidine kinase [Cryobacterium sp. MDB2-A-1]TFC14864.1 two-component sensor histidine kinase [Cryobacterium sp. MDB2-A-2]